VALPGDLIYNSLTSRVLLPDMRSFIRVVGLHDHQLTDSDLNLLSDLASLKVREVLKNQTTSGCLTYSPINFNPQTECSFSLPAFDVTWNGEITTITGNLSADIFQNRVVIPSPQTWQMGQTTQPASIYVVFLEIWYKELDSTTGNGYYVDPVTGLLYVYPYGNVTPDPSNLEILPNDTIDPFVGLTSTLRIQIQWALRVQPIALTYNFSQFRFGLDPGTNASETVWGQGASSSPTTGVYSFFNASNLPNVVSWNSTTTYAPGQLANFGGVVYVAFAPSINQQPPNASYWNAYPASGDTGLWRAGDGNVNNLLSTADGFSYAMPIAVVFQRNSGTFSIVTNPFGCAASVNTMPNSGLLRSNQSGRFDSKFADSIYPEDAVDTRQTVSLNGYNYNVLADQAFADLVTGATQNAIGRGISPGNNPVASGSQLDYYVSLNPVAIPNTDTVGQFDGFANGFSSDNRTFYSTQQVTVDDKVIGSIGSPWILNDAFTIALPATSLATIEYVQVQALVTQQDGSKQPALLLPGQISLTGLGTKFVTVTFITNLTATSYDPTSNPLFVTVGAQYPADGGVDMRQIATSVEGGQLIDGTTGITLPVFGVSDYEVTAPQPSLNALYMQAINPKYSQVIFGTRIWVTQPGSAGVQSVQGGNTVTTFTLTRTNLDAGIDGLYPVRAFDFATGTFYTVASRSINLTQVTIVVNGAVSGTSTVVFSFLANATCQISYNAPVKGVTAIEETVLLGNWTGDPSLVMDNRVSVVSNKNYVGVTNTLVLAADGCTFKGISGDDSNQFIWVQNTQGVFDAVQITSASFQNGLVVINVPPTVNLEAQAFFLCASIYPALIPTSQFIVEESYLPYQGEGVLNRNYELVFADDYGLVTTNGTGQAPIIGLADVYPYNRQMPVSTSLPALTAWSDAGLANLPVASFFDSNFVGKQFLNVENTFEVPLHTNDWIEPFNKDKRTVIQLFANAALRGFNRAVPNIGFAITPVTEKSALGGDVLATVAPIILYVNNVSGNDGLNGLTPANAMQTITAAVNALPSVLRHPCVIQLIPTGTPYLMSALQNTLQVIALGDGTIIQSKYYALANLSFTIQESGRLVISAQAGATSNIVIDATGYQPFGDGPTSAFFVNSTRVIFNQLTFQNFVNPAVYGISADIEFVACNFVDNVQAGGFLEGCTITVSGGIMDLGNGSTGFIADQSEMVVSGMDYVVDAAATPGVFFVVERGSSLTLENHGPDTVEESNVVAATVIAAASLNSNITVATTYQSNGSATLSIISALQRTVSINPFLGGVTADASSIVSTSLS
jgi:hypothetical protein